MLKLTQNRKGQNAIEYMLITTVAIVVFISVLYGSGGSGPAKGLFRFFLNSSLNSAVTGIEDMANSVFFNVTKNTRYDPCGGPCPSPGCRYFETLGSFSEFRYNCDGYQCVLIPTLTCSNGCDASGFCAQDPS